MLPVLDAENHWPPSWDAVAASLGSGVPAILGIPAKMLHEAFLVVSLGGMSFCKRLKRTSVATQRDVQGEMRCWPIASV